MKAVFYVQSVFSLVLVSLPDMLCSQLAGYGSIELAATISSEGEAFIFHSLVSSDYLFSTGLFSID